jgi:HAD superfamily hydrolase (TIGR01509 family)
VIKGLIFDFDGTMVDTETSAFQSWQEIYASYHCDLPLERWLKTLGGSGHEFDPAQYLIETSGLALDYQELRARRYQRKLELVAHQGLMPGVAAYLAAAKELGLKLGLASSSKRDWVLGHLERLGQSQHFEAIVCADDVHEVKPNPALYQKATVQLGLEPQQTFAIEDTINGLTAAKRAGMFCLVVPNAFLNHLPFEGADMRLGSLAEVPLQGVLKQLLAKQALIATN